MYKLNNLSEFMILVLGMKTAEIHQVFVTPNQYHDLLLQVQNRYSDFKDNYTPAEWKTIFQLVNSLEMDSPDFYKFYQPLMLENTYRLLDGEFSAQQLLETGDFVYYRNDNNFAKAGEFGLQIDNPNSDLPTLPIVVFSLDQRKDGEYFIDKYSVKATASDSEIMKVGENIDDYWLFLIVRKLWLPYFEFVFNSYIIDKQKFPKLSKKEWTKVLEMFISRSTNTDYTWVNKEERFLGMAEDDKHLMDKFWKLFTVNNSSFNTQIQSFGCSLKQDTESSQPGAYILNYKHKNF